jgi:hypothetical protein
MKLQKSLLSLIVITSISCATQSVYAASATLYVKGRIIPSTCKPIFLNSGTFDFGTMSSDKITPDTETNLGKIDSTLTITCSANTAIALQATDNRKDSIVPGVHHMGQHGDEYSYGLGKQDVKGLGAYKIIFDKAKADGIDVNTVVSADKKTWQDSDGYLKETLDYLGFSDKPGQAPTPHKVYTIPISVDAGIRKGSELDLSKAIDLDGQVTLELIYL